MPSPFPGMNPYLEQASVWHGFQNRLVVSICDALAPQVSPHFFVETEEYLFIHEPSAEERFRVGILDLALSALIKRPRERDVSKAAILDAPRHIAVSTDFEIERHRYVEIRDRKHRDVVAILEVLSPSNKDPGVDREQYLAKRRAIFHSNSHFIEIDLLRGGRKMPAEETLDGDYCVLVSRAEDRPNVGYWPIMLRDRLPTIPVPLRDPVPLAWLDLQDILHTVYDRAYYKGYMYQGTPEPPLPGPDRVWAEQLAKHAQR